MITAKETRYQNLERSRPNSVVTIEAHGPKPLNRRHEFEAKQEYQLNEVRFGQDLSSLLPAWKKCAARFTDHTIFCDPEWLQERIKNDNANIRTFLLSKDGEVNGAVAFEFQIKTLICRLGYYSVANLPLKVCRLLGYTPNMPEEESAYDLLFQQLQNHDFEAIYVECMRANSFCWQYLHRSPLIKKHFRIYSEHGVRPHPYIRMIGSFEDYMQRFPSKTRNNFSRRIRNLSRSGEVRLVRVTKEHEIDSFVEAAAEISRKTYQYRALGLGIRNPDRLRKWLKWAAQKGWLRSYLLKCGGVPCAFQVAYQYQRMFVGVEVGYDPGWTKFGVGLIQQLLAVEDLFEDNRPDVCDFGTYAEYKSVLANDAYLDERVWLSRRRPTPLLKLGTFLLVRRTSKTTASVLDRLNVKSTVKRWLRKQ